MTGEWLCRVSDREVHALACDRRNNIIAYDRKDHLVVILRSDNTASQVFFHDKFISSISISTDGCVYVANRALQRIQVFAFVEWLSSTPNETNMRQFRS